MLNCQWQWQPASEGSDCQCQCHCQTATATLPVALPVLAVVVLDVGRNPHSSVTGTASDWQAGTAVLALLTGRLALLALPECYSATASATGEEGGVCGGGGGRVGGAAGEAPRTCTVLHRSEEQEAWVGQAQEYQRSRGLGVNPLPQGTPASPTQARS